MGKYIVKSQQKHFFWKIIIWLDVLNEFKVTKPLPYDNIHRVLNSQTFVL